MLNILMGVGFISVILLVFIIFSMLIPDKDSKVEEFDERQNMYIGLAAKRSFVLLVVLISSYFIMTHFFNVEIFEPDFSGVFFVIISVIYYSCERVWYGAYESYRGSHRNFYYVIMFVISLITIITFAISIKNGNIGDFLGKNSLLDANIIPLLVAIDLGAISITKFISIILNKRDELN